MEDFKKTLGSKIRELRRARGMTQAELGEVVGFGKSAVSQWETGERAPETGTVLKLAEFFDVGIDYLFERKDPSQKTMSEKVCKFAEVIAEILTEDEIGEVADSVKDLREEQKRFFVKTMKIFTKDQAATGA